MLLKSTDDGATWSEPMDMSDSFGQEFSAGPGMGIQLQYNNACKGRLIIPGRSHEGKNAGGCYVVYSDDHGRTWHKGQQYVPKVAGSSKVSSMESYSE